MGDLSFAAPAHAFITEDGISARWLAGFGEDGAYILTLGRDSYDPGSTKLFLGEPIAKALVGSLTAAMVARGDMVDYATLAGEAVAALESIAHELRWETVDRSSAVARLCETLERLGHIAKAVQG